MRSGSDNEEQYPLQEDSWRGRGTSEKLLSAQKLQICGNQQLEETLDQILRSSLQSPTPPPNFLEFTLEVRPAVHTSVDASPIPG